ncbi:glycoside hydrolase family 127 protein [Blautia sp.]|uniref:glycoside hydrolase family 127 protein n=1 Tax=Blautia sp. TaxID=1955243 RepID=UPI002588D3CC|nr:beta-L-arabinofuranosidase domain-containing protein [Blautia sp.]
MEKYRLLKQEECKVNSSFWNSYVKLIKEKVIPYQWEILNDRVPDSEPSHAIDNFRIAAHQMEGHFYGQVFQDSDVYKWLEAVGNVLLLERDEELEAKADSVIDIIEAAQEEDGYLNTYFSIEEPDKKWTDLLECHELYCAGHFIESAVAYFRGTGKKKILDIACRLADCLCRTFGEEEGKNHGYPGHQEIELALIKLYDVTGTQKYLELAEYFINRRGTDEFFEQEFEQRGKISFWNKAVQKEPNITYNQFSYKTYNQFHSPVRQQEEPTGHAVRAVYMYTAMADIAARTREKELLQACKTLWDNIVKKQMYITGGIGSTHSGEAFTVPYDLPNDTNYSETCASIGLLFFAQRMLKAEVNRSYADTMEQALYNTVLGGMNREGNRFFYVNPLQVVPETCLGNPERFHVKPERQKWFACACCPPNIARTLPDLWEYLYTAEEDTVYAHLFMGSEAKIQLESGTLKIVQTTEYPWRGTVCFQASSDTEKPLTLAIRIPAWSKTWTLKTDGQETEAVIQDNGYIYIERNFKDGVVLEVELDMEPRFVQSNRRVHYNAGKVAIIRGPLVYCIEEADNGKYLSELSVDIQKGLTEKESDELGTCVVLEGKGIRRKNGTEGEELYALCAIEEEPVDIKAVPYFLWNNRGLGEMQVWINRK